MTTRNNAQMDVALIRRERVSSLRARGMSIREIQTALSSGASMLLNPATGKPFDVITIRRDVQYLRKVNLRAVEKAVGEHTARQYAELQEIKRSAWAAKDGRLALRALEAEMKLLGTIDAGVTININVELVNQVWAALKAAELDPAEVFNNMLARLHEQGVQSGNSEAK